MTKADPGDSDKHDIDFDLDPGETDDLDSVISDDRADSIKEDHIPLPPSIAEVKADPPTNVDEFAMSGPNSFGVEWSIGLESVEMVSESKPVMKKKKKAKNVTN